MKYFYILRYVFKNEAYTFLLDILEKHYKVCLTYEECVFRLFLRGNLEKKIHKGVELKFFLLFIF